MFESLGLVFSEAQDFTLIAPQVVLKATALLLIAYTLHAVAGRRRALVRSVCWNTCLVGLLLTPVATLAIPQLQLPLLPSMVVDANSTVNRLPVESSTNLGRFNTQNHSGVISRELDFTDGSKTWTGAEDATPLNGIRQPAGGMDVKTGWRFDSRLVLLGIYLGSVSLILLRLVCSLIAIQRLSHDCLPVEETVWINGLRQSASRIGMKRPVRLLMSDQVSVPVVVGWLNPAIILPRSLTASGTPGLSDAVLLHELAHIRRGDFGWNLFQRAIMAIYWPHPLVWPIAGIMGAVREQACDDLCVHVMGGPDVYHDSLIEVAAGLLNRPGTSLGMAMAHSTSLGRRLEWIHLTRGVSDCLLPRKARLMLAILVAAISVLIGSVEVSRVSANPFEIGQEPKAKATASKSPEKQDSTTNPKAKTPEAVQITVLAKDSGKPLRDARIAAYVDRKMESLRTDAAGKANLSLKGRTFLDLLSIDLWADGYVQQRHIFSEKSPEKRTIPETLTIELLPGDETLGGKVVDEQGQPIPGVKVEIWGHLGEKKDLHELAFKVDATTNLQGDWRCRSFRKMTWAHLYLSHPDFLADSDKTPRVHGHPATETLPSPSEEPIEALRDFTDVEVLKKGIVVRGLVADDAGKPVNNAEISWIGFDRNSDFQLDVLSTRTGPNGQFRIPHVREGQIVLQVKAPGHAPEVKTVTTVKDMEPLKFTLVRPQVLAGRVVNTKGAPIPGCDVLVDTWRGFGGPGFFLKTDSEGRFQWNEAPPENVALSVTCEGFESLYRFQVNPGIGETPITLKRALIVSGPIIDAELASRIDIRAEIDFGTLNPSTGQFAWKSGTDSSYSGGIIRVAVIDGIVMASLDAEAFPEYRLRIRAKGYRPFESRVFRSDEGKVSYDFRLTKAREPEGVLVSGIVRRPDGKPLEGATVAVAYIVGNKANSPGVRIIDGFIKPVHNQNVVKTNSEGRFSLVCESGTDAQSNTLVIAHSDFYAEAKQSDVNANPEIMAQPWGRIEGVARIGNRLASNTEIFYSSDRQGSGTTDVLDFGMTKSGRGGHFVIERAIPGDVWVNRFYEDGTNLKRRAASTLVKVKPGETTQIEIGGKGRPVIARVEFPEGFNAKADYVTNSEFTVLSDRPIIPYPKDIKSNRSKDAQQWAERWRKSSEGFEYRKNWLSFNNLKLRPDGTLRIEEVPAGDYQLHMVYRAEPANGRMTSPTNIGYVKIKFNVPDIPGGYSDDPLDLGTLRPKLKPTLEVGQSVPAFNVETLDGKRLNLADFRGKYVLLDFWATWCGPCVTEIPEMKEVYERFGKDKRFAMLSLSLDAEEEAAKKFVAEKGITWPQGFLGEVPEGGVQGSYHVEEIPATFLIGPDGKLVAKNLRGREIGAAIARILESQ